MRIYALCEVCKNKRFFVRKRVLTMPIVHGRITSKSEMCGPCFKKVLTALSNKKDAN